jgi:hypothetical protein
LNSVDELFCSDATWESMKSIVNSSRQIDSKKLRFESVTQTVEPQPRERKLDKPLFTSSVSITNSQMVLSMLWRRQRRGDKKSAINEGHWCRVPPTLTVKPWA